MCSFVSVLVDGVEQLSLWDFLKVDMTNSVSARQMYLPLMIIHYRDQVIVSMIIPFSSENTVFRSYKIMPRAQVSGPYCS